jgi:hypothetical protein
MCEKTVWDKGGRYLIFWIQFVLISKVLSEARGFSRVRGKYLAAWSKEWIAPDLNMFRYLRKLKTNKSAPE